MNDVWKPIKGFEDIAEISIYGEIHRFKSNTYTYGTINNNGYLRATFFVKGKQEFRMVHRLVYETFVGNIPEGFEINHKDENKKNNSIFNLELVSHKENCNYGTTVKRSIETKNKRNRKTAEKPVIQLTKDGQFVAEYQSITEAQRQTGINNSNICACCNNKPHNKSAGGFVWKYKKIA